MYIKRYEKHLIIEWKFDDMMPVTAPRRGGRSSSSLVAAAAEVEEEGLDLLEAAKVPFDWGRDSLKGKRRRTELELNCVDELRVHKEGLR
jgi:hypothetical protein